MRIAINLRQYYKGKIGGLENYVRNVISGLTRHDLTIFVHGSEADHVKEFAPAAKIVAVKHETAIETMEIEIACGNFDLLFCPLLVLEPLRPGIPSAVMMPDIQHEFFPDFFEAPVLDWRKRTYKPTALQTDILFTLSEHARSTIVDKYKIGEDKIDIIYLDVDEEFKQPLLQAPSREFKALKLPENYIYFPANFWPHKNHSNLLKAMKLLVDGGHKDLCLVLSGAESDGAKRVRAEIAELGLEKNVLVTGYHKRSTVVEIYQHARALAFVSKFEGFGIPLLEAFHIGCPVVTSTGGSCVEVAKDAAIAVDPLNPASIAQGIRTILSDDALRAELVRKGRERAKEFSWQRAVDLTEAAFSRITHPSYQRQIVEVHTHPTISIVTPTYNMAHYLEETIQSVLTQDYPYIEYVVMDGGSKDGTLDLLRKYDGKFRYCSERDRGQADAINKGYHATSGEIFAYLNADDTYLPGAVGKIAKHFERNPGAGLIYGEAYHVHEDGKIINRYPTHPFNRQTLASQCYICQPAAFVSREAFTQVGLMNVNLHYCLDYELWIRIAKQFSVVKVDDYLATSRMYADNKTLRARRRVYQEIIGTVRSHYGYVPYEWVNGYACYLLDRKDQFFDRSKPTPVSYGLALALGIRYNHSQLRRYAGEWLKHTGFGAKFTDRWDDGWISGEFQKDIELSGDCKQLQISGKHWAQLKNLQLTIKLDGKTVKKTELGKQGPFLLEIEVPAELRGRKRKLQIEANRTWRPMANGDYRRLSCVIDDIQLLSAAGSLK